MALQKLEIIISNSYMKELVNHLEEIGVKGYTAIEISRGKGLRNGEHFSDGFLPTTRSFLIISLVDEEIIDEIFDDLEIYIEKRHGVLFTVPVLRYMRVH